MEEYKTAKSRRIIKQLIMTIVFLVIIIGGWHYPLLGYFIPLCMLLGIGIGFFKGRMWCNWLCPRGSFFDILIKPISPKKKIPIFFKGLPLRIGILSILMLVMTIQIIKNWPDPYKIGMFFVIFLTISTILGIILALILHQRTWCCICPIGSMVNWIGKRKYPLTIDSKLCMECKLCYKACPIQIAPFDFKQSGLDIVRDSDCLKCGLCVSACPKGALELNRDKR
ncbi:MAG: 4Fe-4S ferredoxin iron-sulfur binding protein [uncultured bacterium]|nr:MAG: 4Fe-4S ferredoxin iron-sulfur binding protein [uncultured bacterium]